MGDYLATIQKPHTVYDITPSKQYTWGDYKDFGNSLRTGFVKENLFLWLLLMQQKIEKIIFKM